MTAPDSLLIERPSDDIVVFRLNRPQVRNALNLEVRTRLADEVTRHAADATIRCLIMTGSDTVFAAGADIGEMAEAGPVEIMARNVQKYWRAIMDCPKPVIAAVEGFALGGGLELALCADIIVAGEARPPRPARGQGRHPARRRRHAETGAAGRRQARHAAAADRQDVQRRRSAEHGRDQRSRADRPGAGARASRSRARSPPCRRSRSCRSRKSSMPA